MTDPSYVLFDPEEALPLEARAAAQEARLREVLQWAYERAPAVNALFHQAGIQPEEIRTIDDLHRLPVTKKDQLPEIQQRSLPFGGFLAVSRDQLRRIFVSPGPIYDPEGTEQDYWGFAPALHAAGFRRGDLVLNTFSYHLTPAGQMLDQALSVLGCVVIPGGVGNTEIQARAVLDLGANGFTGTFSFLSTLLHKLAEQSPLRVAFVTGEMVPEAGRKRLEEAYRIRISQGYGTADVGLIAYECPLRMGMHLSSRVLVEILDPETSAPLPPGQVGEVVVTFLSKVYPLVRMATGDLSSLTVDPCPCGRTSPRLVRVIGRVGDAVKVRGIFFHPLEADRALSQVPEVARYQFVVTRPKDQDELELLVELHNEGLDHHALQEKIALLIRENLKLRADVKIVPPGTIPLDAKKVEDRRVWE
ncbi:MAG: AMP-binding protein [Armatimonadota bacterium]|nr:AMP-binding protein [Armatimonadota bacterium]